MSYTSSDPEYLNRDPDTISLDSSSTAVSQSSKTKKKPWSKFKSSITKLRVKMSSKPKFTEPTESSEQKKVKKNKKFKTSASGEDVRPSASEEKPRDRSPKGAKTLIKKHSVETTSTPLVGYQLLSVSPTKSYAKALHKSGSTSESNISTSDIETPRKSLTLDKNTRYSLDSPDSGRVSQGMGSVGDSRPPSQITEEGYVSGTQMEVDSDYNSPQRVRTGEEAVLGSLVSKTEQFAQSLISKPDKGKSVDVSGAFIQAESESGTTKPPPRSKIEAVSEGLKEDTATKVVQGKEDGPEKVSKPVETPKVEKVPDTEQLSQTGTDEIEGRNKKKSKDKMSDKTETSADFIKSEQETAAKDVSKKLETGGDKPTLVIKSDKNKEQPDSKTGKSDEKPVSNVKSEKNEEKAVIVKKPKKTDPALELKPEKVDEAKTKPEETKGGEENETLTHLPKEDEPKSFDKASTSKTEDVTKSPKSPDERMSVEEKLEAFLSAEGWSGTIKDFSVKARGDGSQQPDKRECLYKILVIGELGTGKTSIIKRYVHQFFSQHYRATIGVDFALKVLNWDPNTIIRLQLWDIAGQERFGNMTRVYYKEAVGAFIVFDVTRSATFDAVLKWKQDLDSKVQLADGSPIPCVLLANKCDQQKEGIVNTPAKMEEYCKENNFSAWFETSAKENINIDEAAKSLVSQILQNDKMSQNGRDSARDGSKFPLDGKSEEEGRSCAC